MRPAPWGGVPRRPALAAPSCPPRQSLNLDASCASRTFIPDRRDPRRGLPRRPPVRLPGQRTALHVALAGSGCRRAARPAAADGPWTRSPTSAPSRAVLAPDSGARASRSSPSRRRSAAAHRGDATAPRHHGHLRAEDLACPGIQRPRHRSTLATGPVRHRGPARARRRPPHRHPVMTPT